MSILRKFGQYLIVSSDDTAFAYSLTDGTIKNLQFSNIPPPKNQRETPTRQVTHMVCSKNERFLAVCLDNKQLILLDADLNVVIEQVTNRSTAAVCFVERPVGLLVADKTGDVYSYELVPKPAPRLVLGHLSMLLDMTFARDVVITCDRDEKIRVSSYPNAHNIVSYCLGHDEFVTGVALCDETTLVSASGDGTLRLWSYLEGIQLAVIRTGDNLPVDKDTNLPIVELQVHSNYVAISLCGFWGVQLYRYVSPASLEFVESVGTPDSDPIAYSLHENLIVLNESRVSVKRLNSDGVYVNVSDIGPMDDFFVFLGDKLRTHDRFESVSGLYKKKFDNVNEYLERKRLRIENGK